MRGEICLSLESLEIIKTNFLHNFITSFAYSMIWYVVVCNSSLKSQVVLLQTAHSWANAGVVLGARMHLERGSFRNN